MVLKKKLNIGVIGLGHWGPNMVRAFVSSGVKLRYVCDIDKLALEKISYLLPKGCQCVNDASYVLNDSKVNAVAIVTPAWTHYDIVKKALLANKHVLCEKPFVLNVKEGIELCELAEKVNRKLMVAFTFLYNNGVRKLKELNNSGELGKLYYATFTRTHMGLVRGDVNVIWDLAPHDISIMNFILDSFPEKVSAVAVSPLKLKHSDVAFIMLYYPDGVIVHIHVSWVDSNKERLVRIIGSKARAEFDDLNNLESVRIFKKGISLENRVEADFGNFRFLLRDGDIISPKIDLMEPLVKMVNAFVNSVLDDKESISNGWFALEVTKALVAANKSIDSGGIKIEVNGLL